VLEEVDELMVPGLLPITKQLLHHTTMPSYQQRQTIALGSSALPQQQLAAAAVDVLQPTAVQIRATWPLPQQQQQQQQQRRRLGSSAAPLAVLLADPAAALSAAAAATAAAVSPSVSQRFLGVAPQLKQRTLLRLLAPSSTAAAAGTAGVSVMSEGPTLVFTNSAAAADEIVEQLVAAGVAAGALHHTRNQAQREEALQCFKYGVTQVLVACGVAYRGLDLPDVALVVNYEVPLSLAEYSRRIGITGRQGRPGTAITLITPAEAPAVAPFVALLTVSGQAVPDWLAAMAAGGSSSSSSDGSSSSGGGSSEAAAAPTPAAAAEAGSPAAAAGSSSQTGSSSSSSSSAAAGRSRKQQQQGSSMFRVSPPGLQFGAYNRKSLKGRRNP